MQRTHNPAESCVEIIQKHLDEAVNEATSMKVHNLKSWPDAFEPLLDGRKRFEYRVNDRNFAEGDELVLQEWDPATTKYTGRSLKAKVIYITFGPDWSIPSGACVMSISDPYDIIQ